MRNRLGGILRAAIVALIIVNGFEVAILLTTRRESNLYPRDYKMSQPSGYLVNGKYRDAASLRGPCYLVRIYSKGCPYCKADAGVYNILARRAEMGGCRAISIAPMADEAGPPGGPSALGLQYVDMAFGKALNPFFTPQTILLDSDGQVAWAQAGEMDRRSLLDGEKALTATVRRPHGH